MKIAFIIKSLNIGGVEKVTVKIANEIAKNNEVDLIIIGEKTNYYEISQLINVYSGNIKYNLVEKILRKILEIILNNYAKSCYKEIRFLNQIINLNKYDAIIACSGGSIMLVNELCKCNLDLDFEFISWVHNDYSAYLNKYYKKFNKELKEALSHSKHIIALTMKDKESYKILNKNTTYIYNPITIDSDKITNLSNKEILFVSRLLKEQKGLDYLLEIAKELKGSNWKIRVVGEGPDENWLNEQISFQELQDTIIMHGMVSDNLQDIYSKASLFISTSRWEGFGLVITEAMSCGLPIIAFDNSGPSEILNNGEYGILISRYDIDSFKKAVNNLINNVDLLNYYKNKSLERVNYFKVEKIVEKWEEILG